MIPTMPETASPLMLAMVFCLTIRLRNVAALTAYVAVTLYNRSTASDDARQDNAPIEIAPDSNRALDYTLWPERGEK